MDCVLIYGGLGSVPIRDRKMALFFTLAGFCADRSGVVWSQSNISPEMPVLLMDEEEDDCTSGRYR